MIEWVDVKFMHVRWLSQDVVIIIVKVSREVFLEVDFYRWHLSRLIDILYHHLVFVFISVNGWIIILWRPFMLLTDLAALLGNAISIWASVLIYWNTPIAVLVSHLNELVILGFFVCLVILSEIAILNEYWLKCFLGFVPFLAAILLIVDKWELLEAFVLLKCSKVVLSIGKEGELAETIPGEATSLWVHCKTFMSLLGFFLVAREGRWTARLLKCCFMGFARWYSRFGLLSLIGVCLVEIKVDLC